MELTIRRMDESDLEPLYGLLSDPRVMRYLEPPFTREKTARFLRTAGLAEPPRVYAAERDGAFIGYVIFHEYDDRSMEIGWVLRPEVWGQGCASRLTGLLTARGLKMKKQLVIECDPGQEITRHLALKHGFGYKGNMDGLDVFRLEAPPSAR